MARFISLGMPNYNNASMIEQAVQSALTSKRIKQLVFFDNNSTDDSIDVMRQIETRYPDVNFVIHKRDSNLGTVRNFKDVYLNSSEYYFAWLATDDYVCGGYYDKLAEVLDSSDEGFCAGATIFLHPDGQQRAARSNRPLSGEWHCRLNSFLTDPCENQWCYGLFRREQVTTAILSLNDRPVSDWFMMMRLLNQGEFQFRADCQVYRRKSATQNYFSAANSPFIYKLFHETSPAEFLMDSMAEVINELQFSDANLLTLLKLYVRKIMELFRYNSHLVTDRTFEILKAQSDFEVMIKKRTTISDTLLAQLDWSYPW